MGGGDVIPVLYDGWSLVRRPNSPAALHLLSLLVYHPPEVQAWLALPGPCLHPLPAWVKVESIAIPAGEYARWRWEQQVLPGLARQLKVKLLHLPTATPPLLSPVATVISPSGYEEELPGEPESEPEDQSRPGLVARLRMAFASGGMTQVKGIFWPIDLPLTAQLSPVQRLPVAVHPAFWPGDWQASLEKPSDGNGQVEWIGGESRRPELPESYVLYQGPTGKVALRRLFEAWAWATPAIAESTSLVVAGLDAHALVNLAEHKRGYELEEGIIGLPLLPILELAQVYRGCQALFHPAPVSPWSDPLRLALALEKPVVSLENPLSDALCGPTAYLIKGGAAWPETSRALGAALITVIVEESVSESLAKAARQRATGWKPIHFAQALQSAYCQILDSAIAF